MFSGPNMFVKALLFNTRFNGSCAKKNAIGRPPPRTPVIDSSEIVLATFAKKAAAFSVSRLRPFCI